MFIDRYARPIVPRGDGDIPTEYMIDEATAGTKYVCFDDADKRVIWRYKTEGSVTTVEFGYGAWAQRSSLTYVPINGQLEIE